MSSVHCSTDVRSQLLVSISFPEVTVFLVVFPYMTLNKTMFEGPIPTSTHALSCEQSLPPKKKTPRNQFFLFGFPHTGEQFRARPYPWDICFSLPLGRSDGCGPEPWRNHSPNLWRLFGEAKSWWGVEEFWRYPMFKATCLMEFLGWWWSEGSIFEDLRCFDGFKRDSYESESREEVIIRSYPCFF